MLDHYRLGNWLFGPCPFKNILLLTLNSFRSPEAFLSIQLEKLGPRDVIVNAFVRKKETQGMLLKKEGEIEKLKRSLVFDFCKE